MLLLVKKVITCVVVLLFCDTDKYICVTTRYTVKTEKKWSIAKRRENVKRKRKEALRAAGKNTFIMRSKDNYCYILFI